MKALISLFLVAAGSGAIWAQQGDPPQAPRYDRPRPVHRAPREDSLLNTGPLAYRGVELQGGWLGGRGLEYNVPDALVAQNLGGVSVYSVRLKYDDRMDFESVTAGATLDLSLFRFTLDVMKGRWQGSGTLYTSDGINTTSSGPLSLHGDFWGAKGGIYWPALRLRSGAFEACLGPEVTVAWYYQGLHGVSESPLPIHDKQDELVGGLSPRLSVRLLLGDVDVSLNAGLPYLFGAVEGWATEASLGIGIRF